MEDKDKAKKQLIDELAKLRKQVTKQEKSKSESLRTEEILKESEERFKQLIKNSFDMIVLLDSNGIQYFVSESCGKILGYQSEELINIPVIEQMIHPDDQERAISGLQNIINTGSGNAQYRHRHKSGGWVYLEAYGSNQINNPYINSVVLNVRDITERKQAEEALREAAVFETLTSVLENFISDSLGNLLTPIYGRIELCEIEDNIDQMKKNLGNIKEGITDLISGINAYRKFYKPMDGSLGEIGSVDLRSLLSLLLSGKPLRTYREKEFPIDPSVKLRFVFDPKQEGTISWEELPSVSGSKASILTALQETLINAVESYDSTEGGDILVSAKKEDQNLILEISDKGRGMKDDEREKSQFPFYKVLGIKKSARLGLGAYIAFVSAKYNGGDLQIESKEGIGTTASILLKVSD